MIETLLAAFPYVKAAIGATPTEVADSEKLLGIHFPDSFRRYLTSFGYLSFSDDCELYGLGQGVPKYFDLTRRTIEERTILLPNIPTYFLPFLNDGSGNHFCVDLRRETPDPPVVLWHHEAGTDRSSNFVIESFSKFLVELAKQAPNRRLERP
ncbi:MAG TPA: SMI1/KNR4 family protein [Terriglobales bacterium]|nr:SMI1/KNR4 family protein [Terriglobales bacterium]